MRAVVVALVAAAGLWLAGRGEAGAQVQCREEYAPPPVNEVGILCPGSPAPGVVSWNSYSFALGGPGYYAEMTPSPGGRDISLRYLHADGRLAVARLRCSESWACVSETWNGVPFPFGAPP